jgi:hypothetical protein
MPDHVHLAVSTGSPTDAHARFVAGLRSYALSRRSALWAEVGPFEPISNQKHLLRVARYFHLNPCRDRLVADPLSWEWSTHRDAVGAVADPWLDQLELSRMMRCASGMFASRFHAYVSGDPTVAIAGSPLPEARPNLVVDLAAIELAICSVLRLERIGARRPPQPRKLVVHLARRLGCPSREALAEVLGVIPQTVSELGALPLDALDERALKAARLVLSDPRFLPPLLKPTFNRKSSSTDGDRPLKPTKSRF